MLTLKGKEMFIGMSRKQIEDRGGMELLKQCTETLVPASHKKAFGFSIAARARHTNF